MHKYFVLKKYEVELILNSSLVMEIFIIHKLSNSSENIRLALFSTYLTNKYVWNFLVDFHAYFSNSTVSFSL